MSSLGNTHERGADDADDDTPESDEFSRNGEWGGDFKRLSSGGVTSIDPAHWNEFAELAFSAPGLGLGQSAPSGWRLADADAVGEEVAAFLAGVAPGDTGSWDFTLELGHLGDIDGHVSVEAGHISIELRPRDRAFAKFLNEQRRRLEERASSESNCEVVVNIL